VASDFTWLGRSVIADRDPRDGSDEEAEMRSLVHGGLSSKTVILLSSGMSRYACPIWTTQWVR
jgi:hypothetical protein